MFDKLKQSLPESLRKKMGTEVAQDEESAEYSEEESEESHDTSANESSAKDKKKKQISMIIRVVVVLGLGYMALTEFVFKEEPNNEVPTVTVKPRKPRKKIAPIDDKHSELKTADAGATKPEDAKIETSKNEVAQITPEARPEEPKLAEVQPPAENINIANKIAEEKTAERPAEKTPETIEEKPIDETPIVKTSVTDTSSQVGEVKSNEAQVDKSLDTLIDGMDKGAGKTTEAPKKNKLEDKIVAEETYTPPPAYDQVGRGLVYNCKDKYWACLDKTAYVTCNKNMKWNKAHGKIIECVVQNVYNSDEDCNMIQKYNVSTSKPTTFCQN